MKDVTKANNSWLNKLYCFGQISKKKKTNIIKKIGGHKYFSWAKDIPVFDFL